MTHILWFTGLSGSGKTTIAQELKIYFEKNKKKILILDGDAIRNDKTKNLGFSREDIHTNNKIIAQIANEKKKEYDYIFIPVISPYIEDRKMAKNIIGENFIELFIDCPIEKCIEKDVKGLYQKALTGKINNFIGIAKTNPYEPPLNPDIIINTHQESIEESTKKVIEYLEKKN